MDIGTIGNVLLGLASLSAIASIGAYAFGGQGSESARKLGHLLTFGVFGFTTLAIVLLATAFLSENWALQYVIMNHPTTTGAWALSCNRASRASRSITPTPLILLAAPRSTTRGS